MKNLANPSNTKEIIEKHKFRFNKKLGQNFLIDSNILHKIADGADIHQEDGVLEIGPGIGTLTQVLAEKGKNILAIEIDKKLMPILEETMEEYPNVDIINGDVLRLPLKEILQKNFGNEKIKVVANLPYYVTTSIIMKLLEEELPIDSITIMIQKEVAQRMNATPGGKIYGALSVAVQFYAQPEIITTVPPNVFIPQPKVESTVIKLNILDKPKVDVINRETFFTVVRSSFGQRRKTLLNALSSGNLGIEKEKINHILGEVGIDGKRRGETLSLEEFAKISNYIDTK